jgi:hypothetical protein
VSAGTSEVVVLQFLSPNRENFTAWLQGLQRGFSETAMFRFARNSPIFGNLRCVSQRHRIVERAEDR